MKIYTKKGDDGTTALFGGARLDKDDVRIEAYGTVDELNSFVGLLNDELRLINLSTPLLLKLQHNLFNVGSILATPKDKTSGMFDIVVQDILDLEGSIDEMTSSLTPLRNFILPGGHRCISYCHVCRTICRRAERRIVTMSKNHFIQPLILRYLNRLSDYFFVLGRLVAKNLQIDEQIWIGKNSLK